jgi:hypothetical protein
MFESAETQAAWQISNLARGRDNAVPPFRARSGWNKCDHSRPRRAPLPALLRATGRLFFPGPRVHETVVCPVEEGRAFGVFRCGAQINREMKFQVEFVVQPLRRCPFDRLAGKMDAHGAAWLNVTFKAPLYVAIRNAQPHRHTEKVRRQKLPRRK